MIVHHKTGIWKLDNELYFLHVAIYLKSDWTIRSDENHKEGDERSKGSEAFPVQN